MKDNADFLIITAIIVSINTGCPFHDQNRVKTGGHEKKNSKVIISDCILVGKKKRPVIP